MPAAQSAQNVQVSIRIRNVPSWKGRDPNSVKNTEAYSEICASVNERDPKTSVSSKILLHPQAQDKPPYEFNFDSVFSGEDDQQMVFTKLVEPLITKCLDGFNGCKTYTMGGPPVQQPAQRGIIPRVASQILSYIESHGRKEAGGVGNDYTVSMTYLEIYNEQLRDLLVDTASNKKKDELKIRIDPNSVNGSALYVQGLTEQKITTEIEFQKVLTAAVQRRMVAETNMNAVSSRSHAVLTVTITSIERTSEDLDIPPIKKMSKIHLIDLAGSERANSTGAIGDRLKEGAAINQSLSCLGNVINALSTGQTGHIPYRDSKLTYLLSDSLGGNSLTLLMACITPIAGAFDESLGTLRFAERAKKVKNKPTVNVDASTLRIMALEAENAELKIKLANCTCGASGSLISPTGQTVLPKIPTKGGDTAKEATRVNSEKLRKITRKLSNIMGMTDYLKKQVKGEEEDLASQELIQSALEQSKILGNPDANASKTQAQDIIAKWKSKFADIYENDPGDLKQIDEHLRKDINVLAFQNEQLNRERRETKDKMDEIIRQLEETKQLLIQQKPEVAQAYNITISIPEEEHDIIPVTSPVVHPNGLFYNNPYYKVTDEIPIAQKKSHVQTFLVVLICLILLVLGFCGGFVFGQFKLVLPLTQQTY
ncbi:hypothetical protein HDV01_003555 [Terramyces sp. JEL0728]|nr:hypothetical protein HDV01_003555 [Terramyces sp. JEL0728]